MNFPRQSADSYTPFRIEPFAQADFDDFFRYLGAQLAENGRDGAWFIPLAPTDAGVPSEKQQSFREGFATPLGVPGWRLGWLARDAHGEVAGHIDLRAHSDAFTSRRCVLGMGVRRDVRRLGLARYLLAHATQWASLQGLKWIDLQVLSANEPALSLYRREGFQMLGGRQDMFVIDGVSLGEIWMAREVPGPKAGASTFSGEANLSLRPGSVRQVVVSEANGQPHFATAVGTVAAPEQRLKK